MDTLQHIGLTDFYPRSPRGERLPPRKQHKVRSQFLSTLPARGATYQAMCEQYGENSISIHAPREGSDETSASSSPVDGSFLSTLPARGATYPSDELAERTVISIHAPREGSDRAPCAPARPCADFYPRSPRGERPPGPAAPSWKTAFLSTLPARGATTYSMDGARRRIISIHAPREGSDLPLIAAARCRHNFYPRSPRGERRAAPASSCPSVRAAFLSTLPARGATRQEPLEGVRVNDFYPRSPRGERQQMC